ncbi:hypothetical protein ACQ4LE_006968 [Meloidogyne hapla]
MSSLVQDETECKSTLGTLLYTERKIYGFSAKVIDAILPTSSLFGHVEYKLELKASPHNAIDNEPRIFYMTTRFKTISRLYTTLAMIHRNLYLKDKFPSFAEPKFFGTASSETVTERRNAIEHFLQFVFNNETLCKSKALQAFIEETKESLPTDSNETEEVEIKPSDVENNKNPDTSENQQNEVKEKGGDEVK